MSDGQIVEDSGAATASPEAKAAVAAAGQQGSLGLEEKPSPVAGWRESLDAEIRDHPALTTIADVPALAKRFLSTQEMVGKKGIILPKEGDAADVARFRKEIGVPESVEGYDLGDFTPPEGLPWDDGFQTAMLGKLHAIGIPGSQIKQLFSDYAEVQNDQYQAMVAAAGQGHEQGQTKLKAELGRDYDASTSLAKRAFKAASGDYHDELSHLVLADGTHLGDNPAFVRTFINVGKQFAEHGLAGERVGGGDFMKTPEQAKAEIATLEKNPAYRNADDPEHKMLVDKMSGLYEQAYPTTQPEVL